MATTNAKKKTNTLRSGLSLREFLKHLAVLPHKPPPKMKLLRDFAVRCFLLRPLFELWSRTLNPLLFGGPVFIFFHARLIARYMDPSSSLRDNEKTKKEAPPGCRCSFRRPVSFPSISLSRLPSICPPRGRGTLTVGLR